NYNHHHGEEGMKILHRHVALEALYDSADSFPQPRCHPKTRTKMLDELYNWAKENRDNSTCPIHWLHGPAGAGKSAIMQTLCQRLEKEHCLGGAFFFKRGHTTRGNAKVLFATLAYQLALNDDKLKDLISQSMKRDPSVVGRHTGVQLHRLIVESRKSLPNSAPPILLVDGLDECDTHRAQVEILHLIKSAVRPHPNTFRLLIASRPEAHIRETFQESSFAGILHSTNVEQSFEDIRIYLLKEFARIHREHRGTMDRVPTPWPSPHTLEWLVLKSSGYFVYASTVIKFIDDKFFRPTDRLEAIRSMTPIDADDAPFEALDQLYMQILSKVPARFHPKLCDILYCALFTSLCKGLSFPQIECLLELQPGDVRLILRGLHSVLEINSHVISVHHASFLDFLKDQQRSSNFHIHLDNRRKEAVRSVVKTLQDDNHWIDTSDDHPAWHVALLNYSLNLCSLIVKAT
ncbi:NACHT domain-containing protein, partial [Mycena leptocephala]